MKCYDIKSEENLLPDITDTEIFKDYENNQSDYMRCIYSLFYEKIEQCIGFVFLINKLNLSKLFDSFDKEDKHGEVV